MSRHLGRPGRVPLGRIAFALLVAGLLSSCQSVPQKAPTAQEQRDEIRRYAEETLERLFAEHPQARAEMEAAAGYAVFHLDSVYALWVIGQTGRGLLVDRESRIPYYMRAMRVGTGPGVGYQQLRQVFIFANRESMDMFLLGKSAGGDVNASATFGTSNAQQSFNPYVTTYVTTDYGFAMQANWGGTAYLADSELACEGGTCPPLETDSKPR